MGNAGFGDSGAPSAGEVDSAERADATDGVQGRKQASAKFQSEEAVALVDEGLVAYVAAEEHANSRWLVVPGKAIAAPITAGGTPGMIPLVRREGDVWAKFINGVMVTDNADVIEWCKNHTKICRRSDDPMTKSWATLKSLQARRANRERLLDSSEMDADEAFPAGMIGSLQEQAAKSGSPGAAAVESAETTKESIAQSRAAGASQ